jgi:hypothetical protein
MQKLYCYVDESGQHTEGEIFAVAVFVVADTEKRDAVRKIIESIESSSGKRRQKWRSSKHVERLEYLTMLFSNPVFKGSLYYTIYHSTREYVPLTVFTVAEAVRRFVSDEYTATVFVDGLRTNEEHQFASSLRKYGIHTRKVRGLRDEHDAFIRLVDAIAGLVVDADEGNNTYATLVSKAEREGYVSVLR